MKKYQDTDKFREKVKVSYRERYQNDEAFRLKEIERIKRGQQRKKEAAAAKKKEESS
jgi:hypothetical protein